LKNKQGTTSNSALPLPLAGLDQAQTEIVAAIASTTLEIAALLRDGLTASPSTAEEQNRFGDTQTSLDLVTDDLFRSTLESLEYVGAVATEESPITTSASGSSDASAYLMLLDPLDGSKNVASGGPVGSIFAVARQSNGQQSGAVGDVVAAVYALYSWETTFVVATSEGVSEFKAVSDLAAYGPGSGLEMPKDGPIYAVNEGHREDWSDSTRKLIDEIRARRSLRYTGCFVADFHRILLEGGVFAYPGTIARPSGKLRLYYELIPMAFVARAAGGLVADGSWGIDAAGSTDLDGTSPVLLGSEEAMKPLLALLSP